MNSSKRACCWRKLGADGFFLQGEMHAFVAAILLRMTGLDAFNANARAEPPDGELAPVKQGMGGSKRNAVIAADVGGQSTLPEKPFQRGKSIVFAGRGESFAAQQISAGVIGDLERVTVLVVAEQELTLVIGAPELVGMLANERAVPWARGRKRPRRSTRPNWHSFFPSAMNGGDGHA